MNSRNLANGAIQNNPGDSGTTIELISGYGETMPDVPFFATVTPPGQLSTRINSEIVEVTARTSENLTVTRAQRGTTAKDIQAGWVLSNGVYVEDLDEKVDKTTLTEALPEGVGSENQFLNVVGGNPMWSDVPGYVVGETHYFTSSGTYTKPAGLKAIDIILVGGGGGSSGAQATGAGAVSIGAGGGGGETVYKRIPAGDFVSTEAVDVGNGGFAGNDSGGAAGAGADSVFGTIIVTAHGGGGGGAATAPSAGNASSSLGSGGSGGDGDLNIPGSSSNRPRISAGSLASFANSGASALSGVAVGGLNAAGTPALFPGGGAAGGSNVASQSAFAGNVGAGGLVIIKELF